MKGSLTRSMAWLHTWGGLLFGWILFPVVLTGTVIVFEGAIDMWMQPEIGSLPAWSAARTVGGIAPVLRREGAGADAWRIDLPERNRALGLVSWTRGDVSEARLVDASTASVVKARDTEGGSFLLEVHYSLHAGTLGMWIVGAAGLLMLVAIVSGIVIHKRIFKDFFTFRPRAPGHRGWLDAHNASSVLTLPFQIMIAFTGIAVFHTTFMPAGIDVLYGGNEEAFHAERFAPPVREASGVAAPLAPIGPLVSRAEGLFAGAAISLDIQHPGDEQALVIVYRRPDDRLTLLVDWVAFDGVTGEVVGSQTRYLPSLATDGVLVGLHFVQFGGLPAKWLYFILGLASSVMVATGLVVFTEKRRARHGVRNAMEARLFRLAESFNIAAVAGTFIAMAVYLWANHVMSTDVDGRAAWEVRAFFLAWLATLAHATIVTGRRAWCTQLAVGGALFATIPVVNGVTTSKWIWESVASGALGVAGVDITSLVTGLVLMAVAWAVRPVRVAALGGPMRHDGAA